MFPRISKLFIWPTCKSGVLEWLPGIVLEQWRHRALSHTGRASLSQWKIHECKLTPPFSLGWINKTMGKPPSGMLRLVQKCSRTGYNMKFTYISINYYCQDYDYFIYEWYNLVYIVNLKCICINSSYTKRKLCLSPIEKVLKLVSISIATVATVATRPDIKAKPICWRHHWVEYFYWLASLQTGPLPPIAHCKLTWPEAWLASGLADSQISMMVTPLTLFSLLLATMWNFPFKNHYTHCLIEEAWWMLKLWLTMIKFHLIK